MEENAAPSLSSIVLPGKPQVLEQFDRLKAGESMVVVNAHNPVLLYYQLLADRGSTFDWEYLDRGQPHWRVKISRKPPLAAAPTVGELAARDHRMAMAFQQLGIHYCCEGSKSVTETCQQAGIEPQTLDEHYRQLVREETRQPENSLHDFDRWKAGLLAAYIQKTCHSTIAAQTSSLYEEALALARQKGDQQPEFAILAERLKHFFTFMNEHVQREEQEIYPLIQQLETARKRKRRMVVPIEPPMQSRIRHMELEHQQLGQELRRFKKLLAQYALPAQSCAACQAFFNRLQAFEQALILHVHLESNILFPKVVAAEQALQNRHPYRA